MADLLLKVGDGNGYADGDILCAFNRRRIRCCHAEHLCSLTQAGFTHYGLRPINALARDFREAVCQYRFERISGREIARINLWTGERVVFSDVPIFVDRKWQAIDVDLFIRRQQSHPNHAIFGAPGLELWYGGSEDRSHPKLDRVWRAIELKTPTRELEPQFQLWPMGRLDIQHHLPIRVDDFDDLEAESLVAPPNVPDPARTSRRRARHVPIDLVLGLSPQERIAARDPNQPYDDRLIRQHLRAVVVRGPR